ncbi:hypothetical protein [Streptomyces sp. LN590]|uniref:hypothetical protein n=1 Tax=unclassified Streptomyces TaxID=2593676 RepID=UPI003714569D
MPGTRHRDEERLSTGPELVAVVLAAVLLMTWLSRLSRHAARIIHAHGRPDGESCALPDAWRDLSLQRSDPAGCRKRVDSADHPGSNGLRSAMRSDEQWLVGFRFRTARGTLTRHYYVVPQAADGEQAKQLAGQRARSAGERLKRAFAGVDECWIEVRRLRRSAIGDWRLSEGTWRTPSPGQGSAAVRDAGSDPAASDGEREGL